MPQLSESAPLAEDACSTCGHSMEASHDTDGECWKPGCGCSKAEYEHEIRDAAI